MIKNKKKIVIEKRKLIPILVKNYVDVCRTFSNNKSENIEKGYRVCFCEVPNTNILYTVIDKNFIVQRGITNLCLNNTVNSQVEKLKGYDEWKNKRLGKVMIRVDMLDAKKEFKKIDNWKEKLDNFIDDNKTKDKRLKDIIKSHIIHLNFDTNLQKYNNHSIILTNSGVGKTESYYRINGVIPSRDVTVVGLLGGIDKDRLAKRGQLNGSGNATYDEFPEMQSAILQHLLNYLEQGESNRELIDFIECKGTKCLQFLGNCDFVTEEEFKKNIKGLSEGQLERIGRRFAHILFGEFNTVEKSTNISEKEITYTRNLISSTQNQFRGRIDKIIYENTIKFFHNDKDYTKNIEFINNYTIFPDIKSFLQGCQLNCERLQMGALKASIIDNLDLIVSKFNKETKEKIRNDAKEYYTKFKQYNIESFQNFLSPKKIEFEKLIKKGINEESICIKLDIGHTTYVNWNKRLKNTKLISKEERKAHKNLI